ncbi:MAG TPA: bifunctional rhamnulose-1-phosphate aldolase/short-chain dehydrogenase [Planctomycetota bacterium]|nr:bifunctional rhamnulose-1-phosphate aldolase/short-chain dehydrogenase [Planctomycetota bacterium]
MSALPASSASAAKAALASSSWDAAAVAKLDPVERLVYRSNLLGSDTRVTNSGGGNTSAKITQKDPITGTDVTVLWVKGSGGDLRTAKRDGFASLYQDKLIDLRRIYLGRPDQGAKGVGEDAMVDLYPHCTFALNPRAASIDTPLHGFVPFKHVDHMHPNALIAIAASVNGERLTKEIFGGDLAWIPWQRPGFDLGLKLQAICAAKPGIKGVVMGNHGVINWADDERACFDLTMSIIERAERAIAAKDKGEKTFGGQKYGTLPAEKRRALAYRIVPWLRGQVSAQKRWIGTIQDDERTLRFVNSVDAPRLAELGTSCPDHFLRTKIKPLYVAWDPASGDEAALQKLITAGIAKYRADYAAYYQQCRHADSPALRDANPTVILIPGLGMIAWGKDKSESRVTAEFYGCAIEVMRGAEALDRYGALPLQEAFDIEYWRLEEAKLKRMPPEKELARRIVAVVGAGSGIGREVAQRVAREGATVVCIDLVPAAAKTTADAIVAQQGFGIGQAGTGISAGGPAVSVACDVTDRASVRAALEELVLAYGGLDSLIITAGITVPSDLTGHIPDDKFAQTFAINVQGSYLVADEAAAIWKAQGLKGSLVLTTSANGVVAKKGMIAYDLSKAAANHLVRELAVELAPLVRVNGVAPATVVQGSAMFPRDRVISSLTKYAVPFAATDSDDELRGKLAAFYAERTLTKSAITPADQAEAMFLLVGDRLAKTTGAIIAVDGGLAEAFLR